MMEGLKGEIMEVLKNFVTEKTPESENAYHEIHDEDTNLVFDIASRKNHPLWLHHGLQCWQINNCLKFSYFSNSPKRSPYLCKKRKMRMIG
jgi:hypothetical protein